MTGDADRRPLVRRRSPGWLRRMDDDQLHALAYRLRRTFLEGTATGPQEWLLECCFSELEYRRRQDLRYRNARPCSCELCVDFVEPELTARERLSERG